MRISFLLLVLLHGLIHLLGFIKAFGLSEVKQLTLAISKPIGLAWLLAFIIFALTATMFVFKNKYWWLFGIIAIIISQVLIIYQWHDAKFGTIANVIILMASIIGFGSWSFYDTYKRDVTKGLQQAVYFPNDVLSETDMHHLPEPVKKYLRYTGTVGKPKVNNFKAEFSGKLRKDEQSEWMQFTSQQYNFMQTPTRLFFLNAVMKHMPVTGYHRFKNGDAYMDIRLFSLFKVQYQEGAEMDLSETVTFFNDMCCLAPATLIDRRINWLEADSNKVKASFTNNNFTIFAWLYFNAAGKLINFISNDRYSADAGKQLPWATPIKEYQEMNGYRLMKYAETVYSQPDRDFCYGTFNLTRIEYNCK